MASKKLNEKELENKILTTFAGVASAIGYAPLHGKIIGVLLVKDRPVSLQELAKDTGYSLSMISLSLDFLEVLEVIKKLKKSGDRKLYVELQGDLLEILKKAIIIRVNKTITDSLTDYKEDKKQIDALNSEESKRVTKTIDVLEANLIRLKGYVDLLSELELP
jgi:DNA-binding transcriptional regulator GbsR (MarR family)